MEPRYLIDFVKALENRTSLGRGEKIRAILDAMGITPEIQQCRWPDIKNIIVDFAPGEKGSRLLFSAHYDVVKGSPGANDNASGVAVLLRLCDEFKNTPAPVRIVFFDREEAWLRTPFLRLGLLGSLYYVWRAGVRNIAAVYNVEFCGSGNVLAVWPVSHKDLRLPVVKNVQAAAEQLGISVKSAHIPWPLLTSDHLSFRLNGMANAVTLSLLPGSRVPDMEQLAAQLSMWRLLSGWRPALPEPLVNIHNRNDTSLRLNEDSLQMMLSLLRALVHSFSSLKT